MINQQDIDTATRIVQERGQGSFSLLQRRMKIGYLYAEQLIRELVANGVLGPIDSDGIRRVIRYPITDSISGECREPCAITGREFPFRVGH